MASPQRRLSSSPVVGLRDGAALACLLHLEVDTHLLRHCEEERRATEKEYELVGPTLSPSSRCPLASLLFSNRLASRLRLPCTEAKRAQDRRWPPLPLSPLPSSHPRRESSSSVWLPRHLPRRHPMNVHAWLGKNREKKEVAADICYVNENRGKFYPYCHRTYFARF